VKRFSERSIEACVSSRQPFGLSTTFHGNKVNKQNGIQIFENGGVSYTRRDAITKNIEMIDKYKVFIPRAGSGSDAFPHPILGKPFVGTPGTACSETYIFIGPYSSRIDRENVISYITTRLFRFLAVENRYLCGLPPIVVPDVMLVLLSILPPVPEAGNASSYADVYDYNPFSFVQSIL
jgi:site-specific DNA-methyltransferase (adenine-specific)